MTNFIAKGDVIPFTLTGTKLSGAAVTMTDRAGIVTKDGVNGDVVEVLVEGIVSYPKAAIATTVGQKLYYDSGADKVTPTASSNKAIGWATTAQASGDAACNLKLGAF